MSEPFRIVTVCTMNICRSPVAEELLRRSFNDAGFDDSAVLVRSAGIKVREGAPLCDVAQSLIGNLEPEGTANQVTREQLADADLVLTADRRHRSACIELEPNCAPHAFTLREAARACEFVPDSRQASVLEVVGRMNELRNNPDNQSVSNVRPSPFVPHDDDIADPHVVGFGHHGPSIQLVTDATTSIAATLLQSGTFRP